MNEIISEGWVTFYRYPCVEGYIDRWFGDCADNPNHSKKNNVALNSTAEYFRIGKSKWYSGDWFSRDFSRSIISLKDGFTAKEIWESYFISKKNETNKRISK